MDEFTRLLYNSLIEKIEVQHPVGCKVLRRKLILQLMSNFRVSSDNLDTILRQFETDNLIKVVNKRNIEIINKK